MTPASVAYALTKYAQPSQTFVENEIAGLRRRGVRVQIVAVEHGDESRDDDPDVTYLDAAGEHPLRDHLWWLRARPMAYARFLRRVASLRSELGSRPEQLPWWRLPTVARALRASPVELVHSHFGWSGAAAAACLGALMDVPWSMTLHAKDIFAKRRNLRTKAEAADLVITVCDYNRRWMATHLDLDVPMEVLTCGVEVPDAGAPKEVGADVVTVGRLIPKKGIDLLLRAAARLEPVPTIEVVGDGPERAPLEALAAVLGISEAVRFSGSLPHAAALDRIATGRVFCLPCRLTDDGDRDAMPTVIIEALMRGVPVVSTDVVGIPEMVDDTCGRVVAAEDVDALAGALRELLGDAGLRRRLGEAGAVRARERFSLDQQVDRLLAAFSSMLR